MRWESHDVPVRVLLVGHSRSGVLKRLVGLSPMQGVHNRVLLILTVLLDRHEDIGLPGRIGTFLSLFITAYHITGSG
jgi:hypothetical protein